MHIYIPTGMSMDENGKKIGLALSGGGYRAAAYHIGTLRALYRLGILDKVDVISSVSGGSITAAYYALHKDNFDKFEKSLKKKLHKGVLSWTITCLVIEALATLILHAWLIKEIIECDLICLCGKCAIIIGLSLLIIAIILFLLHIVVPTSRLIEKVYAHKFFGNKNISDLPESPVIAMNATDVEHNIPFTFSQIKMGAWDKYPNGYFINQEIPISLSVMASSAYPLFAPVTIPSCYITNNDSPSPILVDGGIYDNQGAHKLSETGDYHADYIIVSDAGNTEMNRRGTWNVASLLYKIINLMMNRIDKMQRRDNLYLFDKYDDVNPKYPQYAYMVLEWLPADESFISRFITNIKNKKVPQQVCYAHGLNKELVSKIIAGDESACQKAKNIVEQHIHWNELCKDAPNQEIISCAKSVGTNLFGLTHKKIEALTQCAEWMTMVQIKTYLPNIIHQ